MTPERWVRIKEVLGEALELPGEARGAFVESQCGSDSGIRREVLRLLEAEDTPLENPLLGALAASTAVVELKRGEMLAHYRIDGKIGAGGMGLVYKAWDSRLDRRIALKVLRAETVHDPGRRQRLFQEARSASALLHPNIVTVYDIGSDRNIDFIAMEHVEGRPLHQIIPGEGLPARQVIAYAIQIAAALAGAHAAGIVHRDLKPGNIIVSTEGVVKLLDFGLARRVPLEDSGGTAKPESEIAGTPAYMSPEQIRGEPVDHRSDVFAFGAVMYRMATGRDAFRGSSAAQTVNAILSAGVPEPADEGRSIPFALQSVILHCLEKAAKDRFQSAQDVAYALEAAAGPAGAIPPDPPKRRLRDSVAWAVSIAAALVLGLVSARWVNTKRGVQNAPAEWVFAQLTDDAGSEIFPSLSPDGRTLVYAGKSSGNWDIFLRPVGSGEALNLTANATEDDTQPAFSADGELIAFRSERDGGGIFVMRSDGTGLRRLAEMGFNPAWSPDGKSLLLAEEGVTRPEDRSGNRSGLWIVDVVSGQRRRIETDDAVQPQWSSNGRYITYWAIDLDGDRDLWTVPVNGGHPSRITRDSFLDWNPVWSRDGSWIYFCSNRGGSMGIWRVPMKPNSGEARGEPERVRTPAAYPAHLSFSADGKRLAFVQQNTTGRLMNVRFDGERNVLLSEPKEIMRSANGAARPALSPDGKWLAFNSSEQDENLLVMRTDGTGLRQLTSGPARNRGPRWSPDGRRIAFFTTRSGDWEVWSTDMSGDDFRQITHLAGQNVAWPVWSPGGKTLAYTIFGVNSYFIDITRPWNGQTADPLPPFPADGQLFNAWNWSPDGSMLAGFLNRDDGIALYSPARRTFEKLTAVGSDPVWLKESRRLLYHAKGRIHLFDLQSGHSRELISIAPEEVARRGFAVSPDDRYIYFSTSATEADVWLMEFEH